MHLQKKLEPLIAERPVSPVNKPPQKKAVDVPTSRINPVRQESTSVGTAESTPSIISQSPPKTITVEGAGASEDNDAKFATQPSLTLPEGDKRTKWKWLEKEVNNCSISNDSGAVELKNTWTDPNFDSTVKSFYYVRVLENPTCRWSSWDAVKAGTEIREDLKALIQERAWSSPIWYSN